MMIGDAQRDVMLAQQPEDFLVVPAVMAEFERDAPALGHQPHEGIEPLRINLKARGQLKQNGPGLRSQNLQPLLDQSKAVARLVAEPLPVRDKF